MPRSSVGSTAALLLLPFLGTNVAAQGCPNPNLPRTLQVLNYNNLGSQNNGTAAVLVHDKLDRQGAALTCSGLGESLLSVSQLAKSNLTELQYQLDYLVATKTLDSSDSLWVGGENGNDDCVTYSHSSKSTSKGSCDQKLMALCSSTVAPTTDINRDHAKSSEVTVPSNGLSITGYRDKRSFRFLGVPFANPPVKKLRFMAPQNYSGPAAIDATKMAPSCWQHDSPYGDSSSNSEDCLYLNVFTPVIPAKASETSVRRPVAVYFYGGAFIEGAISLFDYDGGNFASRSDVVIVTVNYRLGALGFLASETLLDGSLGIKDQIQALRWVKDNIAAFGGDPSQVSIFGQSAGGQSTVAVMSSSSAKGLFHRAIAQSAPVDLPWYPRSVYTNIVTPRVATAVGCDAKLSEKDLVACLQEVPASSLIKSSPAFTQAVGEISREVAARYFHSSLFVAQIEPFMPMLDDKKTGVIDDQFDVLLKNGKLPSAVPVMFTSVRDEATLFVNGVLTQSFGSQQAIFDSSLAVIFPPKLATEMVSSGAFVVNKDDPDGVRNLIGKALTESEWTCPQGYLMDNGGTKVFPSVYQVQIADGHEQSNVNTPEACLPNNSYNSTCHTADVLPIWGTLNGKTKNVLPYYSNNDLLHSQYMNDVWGSFFRTSDPNPDAKMLKIRGPAYEYSLKVVEQDKYRIEKYKTGDKEVASLGIPSSKVEYPGISAQCAVFTKHGYTFQNAKLDNIVIT